RAAGNPTEIVRVQTSFWRKQFDELATQAEEARNRLFRFNVARPKTLEASPEYAVEEPAKKALARSQRKGHNRSERDPASASLEKKVGTLAPNAPPLSERAARSGACATVGKQLDMQRTDTPKTLQKLP